METIEAFLYGLKKGLPLLLLAIAAYPIHIAITKVFHMGEEVCTICDDALRKAHEELKRSPISGEKMCPTCLQEEERCEQAGY